jgi:hypothetical protein
MGMNEVSRSWIAAWSFAPTIGSTELVIGGFGFAADPEGDEEDGSGTETGQQHGCGKIHWQQVSPKQNSLVACHAERLNQRNTKLGRGPTKVLGLFELAKRNSAHGPGLALT